MAATMDDVVTAHRRKPAATGAAESPASVLLFVTNTDNPVAQQRALDALNRHSCVVRARFAANATRQFKVDYWSSYASLSELINTARVNGGVDLRVIG